MFNEFKKFIAKGNVMDMAVGIVIGAAFTAIVTSAVKDIITPPIGYLTSGIDFSDLFVNLSAEEYSSLSEAEKAGAPTINYGRFLNSVINFLIISFAVFFMVKGINELKEKEEEKAKAEPPAAPPAEVALLEEIRDLLKEKK